MKKITKDNLFNQKILKGERGVSGVIGSTTSTTRCTSCRCATMCTTTTATTCCCYTRWLWQLQYMGVELMKKQRNMIYMSSILYVHVWDVINRFGSSWILLVCVVWVFFIVDFFLIDFKYFRLFMVLIKS